MTVEAVVIGDFQNGDSDTIRNLGGFWIQEEDTDIDNNPATSEGIFVYEGVMKKDVVLGDKVKVTGSVKRYNGRTQITAATVSIVASLGESGLPSRATVLLDETGQSNPNLEAYDGMLVVFRQKLTITDMYNLDRYNTIRLVAGDRPYQYTQLNRPSASGNEEYLLRFNNRVITYDDGLTTKYNNIAFLDGFGPEYTTASAPRLGDYTNDLQGVLTYSFGSWRVISVKNGTNHFTVGNPRPLKPTEIHGKMKVASYNVMNFFTTLDEKGNTAGPSNLEPRGANNRAELDRQIQKLVTNIVTLDADILGLLELENNFIGGDPGNALELLVDSVNAALGSGVTYAYVYPGVDYIDSSDAISVGIMYKVGKVKLVGSPAILHDDPLTETVFDGAATSRPPLAVTFAKKGLFTLPLGCITIAVNHFKSKDCGGAKGLDQDQGDGAGCFNHRRLMSAKAVVNWLKKDPTQSYCPHTAIVGDLNSYAMEDPVRYLTDEAGYVSVENSTAYSYVFDGQIGTLDYIFLSRSLVEVGIFKGSNVWHINEDEANALDYNLDFGRLPSYFDGTNPARSSDHSPIVAGLKWGWLDGI